MRGKAAGAFFAAVADGALHETFGADLFVAIYTFEGRIAA
jgi:hypothetical protein